MNIDHIKSIFDRDKSPRLDLDHRARSHKSENKHNNDDKISMQSLDHQRGRELIKNRILNQLQNLVPFSKPHLKPMHYAMDTEETVNNQLLTTTKQLFKQTNSQEQTLNSVDNAIQNGLGSAFASMNALGQENNMFDFGQDIHNKLMQKAKQFMAGMSENQISGSQSYAASFSSEVEIKTKEGDIVKINISRSTETSISAQRLSEGGQAFNAEFSLQSSINISVEGDLSEQELNDIQTLLQKLDNVSNSLSNSDADENGLEASLLGSETSALSAISFINEIEERYSRMAAYTQAPLADDDNEITQTNPSPATLANQSNDDETVTLTEPNAKSTTEAPASEQTDVVPPAVQSEANIENTPSIFQQLFEALNFARNSDFFNNPFEGVSDILSAMVEQKEKRDLEEKQNQNQDGDRQHDEADLIDTMVNNVEM
ncbi:MAG: hypothetical protein OEY38_04310 [Gammaproteobacteria bacterium]|nr:hypothetical protein [Gammaproteobacteria bacterium]